MGWSQDLFFSSHDVFKYVRHSVAALHGQGLEKPVQERVIGSARRDVGCTSESGDSPRSFAGLIQIYSDKTAKSSKVSVLVGYPVHVVQLKLTEERTTCRNDYGHVLLGILSVGAAELREGMKTRCRRKPVYARIRVVRDGAPGRRYGTELLQEWAGVVRQSAGPSNFIFFKTAQRGY